MEVGTYLNMSVRELVLETPASILQKLREKTAADILVQEALFVDEIIRRQFPEWLWRRAQSDRFGHGLARAFMTAYSAAVGIHVERHLDRGMRTGRGFRSTLPVLESFRSVIKKGDEVLGETRYNLNIIYKN